MGCNCNEKKYSISMGCCQPVLGPIENYYTKYAIDKMLEEIESGITSGCCITPEEVDEKIDEAISGISPDLSDYYTKEEVDELIPEVPSLSGYATEQWVEDKHYITGVDLSDYALKSEIPTVPTSNTAFTNDAGYLTEHQHLKTINGQSLVGDGDIEITTGGTIDLSNYYTTAQTVNLVESAVTRVEGEMPTVPTSNTAFTNDAGYLTEHQSLSGYATEQWVEDKHYITGVDLSDYVTYESLPDLSVYATKQWVINQNYALNSELIQYITNLQNQIDSLKQQISGCCGSTGETITRWITMTGENDYTCSGTTKMTKEKEQTSTDGGNTWTDTGNYRSGLTVLEQNSVDCGYVAPLKFYGKLGSGGEIKVNCNSSSVLSKDEVYTANYYTAITIGNCVSSIGEKAFLNSSKMVINLNIPNNVKTIGRMAFANSGISALTLNEGIVTLGDGAFKACSRLSAVTIPNSVTQLVGDTFYTNNIKTLVIGSGVTSIGAMCFQRSSSVTGSTITILATTPPTIVNNSNIFSGWGNAPIYVPSASVNAYKNSSGWSQYASRIQAIP